MLKQSVVILACLAAGPALAQASATVSVPGLSGHVETGNAAGKPHQRTSDASPGQRCNSRGVTVRSADGSVTSSASASGDVTTVAGSGSRGSKTKYFGCNQPNRTGDD